MKETQHPTEPPPVRGSWRAGETITFGGLSDKTTGHMGYTDRVGPSVLVLPEAQGLGPGTRAYVDRLAEEGFTALAPDLYGEPGAMDSDPSGTLDLETALKSVRAAATHLTENWHPRLGVVGFSEGAWLGTRCLEVVPRDATVAYYGYDTELVAPDRWSGPLLGHFAAIDKRLFWVDVDALFRRLARAGHDVDWHRYEGTRRSFASPDTGTFDIDAAEMAWERTIEALYYHLS
ncbi:MAG: dienelactone hydrolase family protein [Actinomycetota bacterium]